MKIVARHVFHDAPAAFRDHAVTRQQFNAETSVRHSAVEVAQWRTGVCGDDAADGGAIGKGHCEWEKLILLSEDPQQILNPHTRLHSESQVARIVCEDSIHPREIERDVVAGGWGANSKFRAASAGDHSKLFRGSEPDDFSDLRNFHRLNDSRGAQSINLVQVEFSRV